MPRSVEELKNIVIENYTYSLPKERIAKFPVEERDASKLLYYSDGDITRYEFRDAPRLLHSGQHLVFNNTKVIHARLLFRKPTGASVEVFCIEPETPRDYALNFAAKNRCEWICMVGNLKKWRDEAIAMEFMFEGERHVLTAVKSAANEEGVRIAFSWDGDLSFGEVIEICGKMPIPPYLEREAEASDELRYQTVYSREEGSVAAPTAGLHFTESVLDTMKERGIRVEELTLHVGAGTFKPVKSSCIGGHDMHTEHFYVSSALLRSFVERQTDVVAVGTTSVRTLESLYWMGVKLIEGKEDFRTLGQWEAYELPGHYSQEESFGALLDRMEALSVDVLAADTTIMIVPGYEFKVADYMFTNFHQPRSTLLLLIAAAIGEDWTKVYDYAMRHEFRFLSYGDSSLLKIKKPHDLCSI